MIIESEKMKKAFEEISEILDSYNLPLWEELPEIELYMDQVVAIIGKYLKIFSSSSLKDKIITSSMINNYVKLNIIPAPVKKKYSRKHLAYLIIVCTLKQTLDMATIKKIIPSDLENTDVERLYNSFVENQKKAFIYVNQKANAVAKPIFELEESNPERLNDLLMQICASSSIIKIMTDKIIMHQ